MSFLILIALLLFLGYAALILFYRRGWNDLPIYKLNKQYHPKTLVSIIIPARNEEKNIGSILKDILSQYYPTNLLEIIVVDDHSTDQTSNIVQSFQGVKYISLDQYTDGKILNSYKKKAIEIAISQSRGELILTTDADCNMGAYWLLSIVSYFEKHQVELIASPVIMSSNVSWFQQFQSLDFMTMQGITGAVVHMKSGTMCNGANLAYTRKAFDAVGGFKDIDDIASGDDMLLMYKIEQQFPRKTRYLKCKESIISTQPMTLPKEFMQQRIRWASKARKFKDKRIIAVLALVYLYNLMFVFLLLAALFRPLHWTTFFGFLLCKVLVELYFLIPVTSFFDKRKELYTFYILQFVHIPYILISGMLGQFGTYDWKGRQVK